MQSDKKQKIMNVLLETLLADEGLSSLTEKMSEILNCSVLITGSDLQYLAGSICRSEPGRKITELLQKEMKNGYLSSDAVRYAAEHHLAELMEKQGVCQHYIEALDTDIRMYPIRVRRIMAGKLVLLSQHTEAFSELTEYLPMLSRAVSQELQKRQQKTMFNHTTFSAFLLRVLENPDMPRNILEEIRSELHLELKDKFYAVVLKAEEGELQDRDMEILIRQMQRFMKELECVPFEGKLMVLLNFPKDRVLSRYMMKNLKQFAIGNSLNIGISNVFTDILELRRFYEQACRAIRLGMQHLKNSTLTPVYLYYDYSYCDLMENCSESVNLLDIVYPPLLDLLEYDRQKDSDLMDTLFQYLLHNANTQLTAQSMSTHKNTILYRLNLIKEIIQNDLSAGENLFIINLSLRIMTHLRLFVPQRVTDKYDMASPNLDIED